MSHMNDDEVLELRRDVAGFLVAIDRFPVTDVNSAVDFQHAVKHVRNEDAARMALDIARPYMSDPASAAQFVTAVASTLIRSLRDLAPAEVITRALEHHALQSGAAITPWDNGTGAGS